jgi:hypothetical protein
MVQSFALPGDVSPISAAYQSEVLPIPDIIEFVVSDKYLNRPRLYPRQATMLKVIFLRDDLFTDYDYQVIDEWSQGFTLNEVPNSDGIMHYEGYHGMQPDIHQRIYMNQQAGRKWFKECVVAIGRRGSKGYIGALCGAYVLWNFLAKGDPQEHYGISRDKPLTGLVFAGKLNQAKAEQFGDLKDIIIGSNCFAPYVSMIMAESLSLYAPSDAKRIAEMKRKGLKTETDLATFRLMPKESTLMSGRGPASFLQYYDEMAHVTTTSAKTSAEDIYGAATPSLDQFKPDGFIYEGSSTWQMMGQYYDNWVRSLEVDYETRLPVYPELFMVQLESWDPYKDWEISHTIKMRRGYKRHFNPLDRAIQTYDTEMRNKERANPETFKVEYRSRWAASMNAYLNPERIKMMWDPKLEMQERGHLHMNYAAHIDPSKSGANTGLAIGHIEGPDDNGYNHVIFDLITHWQPGDFPENNNEIDYIELEEWWNKNVTDAFMPDDFTFDQFETSIIQRIANYARSKQRPKTVNVYERTATKPVNWKMAESFKTAMGLGLLHCFSGDTSYLTWDGYQTFGETVNTTQRVLTQTGHWVDAEIRASTDRQYLLKLTLGREGQTKEIFTTPGHRWIVKQSGHRQRIERCPIITTDQLKTGDRLASTLPVSCIANVHPSPYGIVAGIVFGDGSKSYKGSHVTLWGEKDAQLLRYFPTDCIFSPRSTPNGCKGIDVGNLPRAFKELPDINESPGVLYGWLAGYFAADGTVGPTGQVTLGSVSRENLEFVKLVATRLGIATHPIAESILDTEWSQSDYFYNMSFVRRTLRPNFFLIAEHRDRFVANPSSKDRLGWKVISVEKTDRFEQVFCAVVPETESFVLQDWILTKNSPYYEQADIEMIYLQDMGNERVDHPTMGPVQTKDVWDAMANVVYTLIGGQMMAFLGKEFSDFGVKGQLQGGSTPWANQFSSGNDASAMFDKFSRASGTRQAGAMARQDPSRSLSRDRPRPWSPSSPWKRG